MLKFNSSLVGGCGAIDVMDFLLAGSGDFELRVDAMLGDPERAFFSPSSFDCCDKIEDIDLRCLLSISLA